MKEKFSLSDLPLFIIAAPIFILLGAMYSWPAMHFTKERDPWLTTLLMFGLAITVFGLGYVSHIPLLYLAAIWGVSIVFLLLERARFGLTGNFEHFGFVHLFTLLLIILALIYVKAQQKASKKPNAPQTQQKTPLRNF